MSALQKTVLAIVALVWVGGGLLFASVFAGSFPQYAPRAYAAAAGAGLVVALLHLGILRLFPGRAACWGMVIAKLAALFITVGAGFWAFVLGVMSTDSGLEPAAEAAWMTVPLIMLIPAVPATLAALIGAWVGQAVAGRSAARAAAKVD
jgi:hypothetical protein